MHFKGISLPEVDRICSILTELFLCSCGEKTYIPSTSGHLPHAPLPTAVLSLRYTQNIQDILPATSVPQSNLLYIWQLQNCQKHIFLLSLQIMLLPGKIILLFSNEPILLF